MKQKKLFVVVLLFSIWLAGCENGLTNPDNQSGPSKTTVIEGEIGLWAEYYTPEQAASLPNWSGGWEFNPKEQQLKLSNLMPGEEIKNDTSYTVAISGELSGNQMNAFQFVFTVPGIYYTDAWIDLSSVPAPRTVQIGNFSIIGTLKTKGRVVTSGSNTPEDPYVYTYVKDFFNNGMLAFTNAVDTVEDDHNKMMATLKNVVITITEK